MGRITRIKASLNSDYKMVKGQPNYRQVEFETLLNLIPLFFHFQIRKPEVLKGKTLKLQSSLKTEAILGIRLPDTKFCST